MCQMEVSVEKSNKLEKSKTFPIFLYFSFSTFIILIISFEIIFRYVNWTNTKYLCVGNLLLQPQSHN